MNLNNRRVYYTLFYKCNCLFYLLVLLLFFNYNMKDIEKIALVIEGGGFKSVFSAGVLDAFLINKFNPFDIYIGVSSGAMCLSYYVSRYIIRQTHCSTRNTDINIKRIKFIY